MTTKSYQIRVRGQIPPDELIEFDNVTVVAQPAETVLRSQLIDQAALQGILHRLSGLGLELIEVQRLPDVSP